MPPEPTVEMRSATAGDAAFIVEMARHACVIEDRPLPDADSEDTQSLVPRSHDVAVIAEDETGLRLGAAWTFHHDPPLVLETDADALPEIAIAVTPERRGSGVGSSFLDDLFARCTDRYDALSLNVHKRNPASRLYERKGFRVLGQGRGTLGIAMRRELR